MNIGNILLYLSMKVMLEQGVVTVDMSYYLMKVLEGYNNLSPCSALGEKIFLRSMREQSFCQRQNGRSFTQQ
jgi:hypothetical protein